MELLIVTGMSGSGKSTAVSMLEDIGYYCVDNIPPRIIPSLVDMSLHSNGKLSRIAIVTDIRGGEMFKDITAVLDSINIATKVLFLEAADNELHRRYKENRRSHPLFDEDCASFTDAIKNERKMLESIRLRADYILDTTFMSSTQLKQRITDLFAGEISGALKIHCMSFGFKYGAATEADLVFDVRCLPNPFYIQELKGLNGTDREIKDFVLQNDESKNFLNRLTEFLDAAVPLYKKEGKSSLTIAFGCTGGQHRSVTFAEITYARLSQQGYNTTVSHRDMNKGRQ